MQEKVLLHDEIFAQHKALQEKISSQEEKINELMAENERLLKLVESQANKPASQMAVINDSTSASSWAAAAAKPAATSPAPAKKARAPSVKKRAAAARAFMSPEAKGPQGFKYIYLGRSRKINRSEVRSRLRRIGVDTGRILDISFPASGVLGVLMHVQYADQFTATMQKAGAEIIKDFDPLDPKHLADPKFSAASETERAQELALIVNARSVQTLSFLRPLVVRSVARSFLEWGWIDDDDVKMCLSVAEAKLPKTSSSSSSQFAFRSDSLDDSNIVSEMEL